MTNTFANIVDCWKHIPYTLKHIVWVNKISWKYFHKLYPIHDMDKVVLYVVFPFKGTDYISKLHRSHSTHHDNNLYKSNSDYIEMVCDWESARFTKPDKPLNATATCDKYYPHLKGVLKSILNVVNGN